MIRITKLKVRKRNNFFPMYLTVLTGFKNMYVDYKFFKSFSKNLHRVHKSADEYQQVKLGPKPL